MTNTTTNGFQTLGLPQSILTTLDQLGYAQPSEIQAAIIPHILAGRDVIGQAQTGTGKTAAFSLPVITRTSEHREPNTPSTLILCPTRELAVQVAEAIKTYSRQFPALRVTAIYGGQSFRDQIRDLKSGCQIVVGTPGRILDHHRRGTLKLHALKTLVLDEADEMLRMGFIEDVETVVAAAPNECQIALLSATMPPAIRRIAQTYLKQPEEVTIKSQTATVSRINQRYLMVAGNRKQEAMLRLLDVCETDGTIIFARTRAATTELAELLQTNGHRAVALNGDISQEQREQIVEQMRQGRLDVLVATDVAARGLDISRISHVINYDVPQDPETYVHRVGRTGRAGRHGEAILFVTPKETRSLHLIERVTRQPVAAMPAPDANAVTSARKDRLKQRLGRTIDGNLGVYQSLVEEYLAENPDQDPIQVAAAFAAMAQGDQPLVAREMDLTPARGQRDRPNKPRGGRPGGRPGGFKGKPGGGQHRPGGNRRPSTTVRNKRSPARASA